MGTTAETGRMGERAAAEFLRRAGYEICALNWRSGRYELDIVARKGDFVHFVEVKTRTNLSCGLPREYVTPKKQERLRKTAAWYLMVKDLDCPARFDVAEVYAEGPHPQKASRIEYIEDAF